MRQDLLKCRYYLKPFIKKMQDEGKTLEQIGNFFDCSRDTIRLALNNNLFNEQFKEFGEIEDEYLRVAAVHACWQFMSLRGWQVGETDAKSVFDLFCIKNAEICKIQVRSSRIFDKFGKWPIFKVCRQKYNTSVCERIPFDRGDFDYWFFYSINRDAWMIPFDIIKTKTEVSIGGFDEYYCGPF